MIFRVLRCLNNYLFAEVYGHVRKVLLFTPSLSWNVVVFFYFILSKLWKKFNGAIIYPGSLVINDYLCTSTLSTLYRVSLYREELPREKADSGLINSLVSFIVASSEAPRSLSKEVRQGVGGGRVGGRKEVE